MENSDDNALAAGDSLSGLELDGSGYDANDEILLLRIMGTSNEAVSPNLQAVLDDHVDFAWTAVQRPQSPLLMERPRSSGIGTAAFSFARPAQNGKPFSLQPASRRPSSSTLPAESGNNEHVVAKGRNDGRKDKAKYVHFRFNIINNTETVQEYCCSYPKRRARGKPTQRQDILIINRAEKGPG
jgi:hypothetical protein